MGGFMNENASEGKEDTMETMERTVMTTGKNMEMNVGNAESTGSASNTGSAESTESAPNTGNAEVETKVELNSEAIKKGVSNIGIRYAVIGLVISLTQIGLAAVFQIAFKDSPIQTQIMMTFLAVILSVDVIGFALAYFWNKPLEKGKIGNEKLSVGAYISGIFMCAGICLIGIIVGLPLHLLLTLPFGIGVQDSNDVANMMLESGMLPRILTVGILAPIFEELIFRKILVDCMSKYGKVLAILTSGIFFGLFHGNFQQCFFAMGIGWLFAYVYVKTGNILYTISYHMIVNCTTSGISIWIVSRYFEAMSRVDLDAVAIGILTPEVYQALPAMLMFMGWFVILFIVGIVGIILLLCYMKTFTLKDTEGELKKGESMKLLLSTPGFWAFVFICFLLFFNSYGWDIIASFNRTKL